MENLNVYKDLIKRMLTMVDAGVTDSAPAAYRQPSSVYTDPALFAREKATIFKDEPQLVCFSSDLPEKGSYFTFDDLDVPVLPTHFKCPHSGAAMPVERADVWVYQDDINDKEAPL